MEEYEGEGALAPSPWGRGARPSGGGDLGAAGGPLSLHLPQRAPGGTLSLLQQLEASEDALRLLPGAAFLSLTRGCQPWSSQWQPGRHPRPGRAGVSGGHLPERARHLPSWQCGCRLLEDTKRCL